MNSLRVTNSSCFALHFVWGSSHPPRLPHFHAPASVMHCPSCFLSRRWPFRWCLSRPPWPVATLGAIMDWVLIACWRTEAVLHSLIATPLRVQLSACMTVALMLYGCEICTPCGYAHFDTVPITHINYLEFKQVQLFFHLRLNFFIFSECVVRIFLLLIWSNKFAISVTQKVYFFTF